MHFLSRFYGLTLPALRLVRSNRTLIRCLFGVNVPKETTVQFDPTTVGLSRILRDVITDQDRSALEIGIGEGGLINLSLLRFVARRGQPLSITGVDCSAERVKLSRLVADFNNLKVELLVGDMFSEIPPDRKFDLIFFNPPYIPTSVGQQMRLDERLSRHGSQVWDGGPDGTSVLSEFLQKAPWYLSPTGRVVFGVQSLFVPELLVHELLRRQAMRLLLRRRYRIPPSVCYVVRPLEQDDR